MDVKMARALELKATRETQARVDQLFEKVEKLAGAAVGDDPGRLARIEEKLDRLLAGHQPRNK